MKFEFVDNTIGYMCLTFTPTTTWAAREIPILSRGT